MDLHNQDVKLVLFGAGGNGKRLLCQLIKNGITPAYFVDNNCEAKYVECTKSAEMRTLSVKKPNVLLSESKSALQIIITPEEPHLSKIKSQLCKMGLSECLIEYDDLFEYGCTKLDSELRTLNNILSACLSPEYEWPSVEINFEDYEETINRYIQMRQSALDGINGGIPKYSCPSCPLKVKRPKLSRPYKVKFLGIADLFKCNFSCIYCTSKPLRNSKRERFVCPDYRLLLNAIMKMDLLSKDCKVCIYTDEISIYKKFDEVITTFLDFKCDILTNAFIYRDEIKKVLENGKGSSMCVSIDAGTRETFAHVKGRDAWERVCENLKKYSGGGGVTLSPFSISSSLG